MFLTQMIKISIARIAQFQRTEADIVKSFVIDAESLVRILHQLMHRKCRIVRLDNSIRNLKMDKLKILLNFYETENRFPLNEVSDQIVFFFTITNK
jgi:hypothetical protein